MENLTNRIKHFKDEKPTTPRNILWPTALTL